MERLRAYGNELSASVGVAWNHFWFTPTPATTLGVLRVLVGAMAFYAIATYAPDLDRWFGPGGMLPLELVRGLYPNHFSLLDAAPPNMLWPAFWASLVVIALFTLGIGGRITAALSTIATLSFFSRAPLVTGEFEPILAFLLAYLCLGRASDALSLPALLHGRARGRAGSLPQASSIEHPVSASNSISLHLIQIHVAIVHVMMGFAQLAAPEGAWWNGEGVWLAAMRPGMAPVDLSFLTNHPRVVAAWSHLITLYLLAFPALAFLRLSRPIVLAIGVVVWLSLAVASGWLMFCLVMLVSLIAFVEPTTASGGRSSR